jgi:hypothetical protein
MMTRTSSKLPSQRTAINIFSKDVIYVLLKVLLNTNGIS